MNKIRLGMLSFAHPHAYSYAESLQGKRELELVGIYDEEEARGRAAAERFGTAFYGEMDRLLRSVDGVIICSDNSRHYPYAMAAAQANVHILVEKPITVRGEEARSLIDACAQRGLKLQTAFPVRFNASVRQVKVQIERGEIGEVVAVNATNHGRMPGGWFVDPALAGGGAVIDHTVHVVDVLRWFLGSEVEEVYAEAGTLIHDIPVDDCGLLSMRFGNGTIATLDASWSRPRTFSTWGDVTMRIVGTKGVIHLDVFAQAGQIWDLHGEPSHRLVNWGDGSDDAMVGEFAASIREGREPAITGTDGLRAAEVAWAAYEAARSGKPVQVRHY